MKRMLAALGIGAGAMYFFDPQLGNRRRALVRDKIQHFIHEIQDAADVVQRDFNNRLHGLQAMLQRSHEKPSDDVLCARVRSRLGRVTSHPGAVEVAVHDGVVTLRGPILAREVQQTVRAIESVEGVSRVKNELEVHESADISALQGGRRRSGVVPDILQENWSPTTRLLVGGLGAGMVLYGSLRRAPVACFLGTAGLALLARSTANLGAAQALPHTMGHAPAVGRHTAAERSTQQPGEAQGAARSADDAVVEPSAYI